MPNPSEIQRLQEELNQIKANELKKLLDKIGLVEWTWSNDTYQRSK